MARVTFRQHPLAQRYFWPATAGLLIILAAVEILTMRGESQTYDEATELASGYGYLKTGEYRIDLDHPPLARVIAALPLVIFLPPLHIDWDLWQKGDIVNFGPELLYRSSTPARTILSIARGTSILATLALGLALALWTRKEFGPAAALFALTLFAFDPTVIAHGHYVKNDVLPLLWCLLACGAWIDYLRKPGRRALVWSGIFLGLAIGTKFSSLFLLPVFVLLAGIQYLKTRRSAVGALLLVCLLGFGTILLIYAPHAKELIPTTRSMRAANPSLHMLSAAVDNRTAVGRLLGWTGKRLGLRAHPLLVGLNNLALHNFTGHTAYFLGMVGKGGWWYYFPVAFAVKTPVATLLIIAISILMVWRVRRLPNLPALACLMVIVVFAAFSMSARINIGIRHLLPIYPFLFALLGAFLAKWRPRYAVLACTLLAAESLAVFPNYTAFFNVGAGGLVNQVSPPK